jgi:hypothetical protein
LNREMIMMNKNLPYRIVFIKIILTGILLLVCFSCKKNSSDNFDNLDLLAKINSLEGVNAIEISPQNGYARAFQIDIIQPVDHNNPSGTKFTQRIYLSHADETKPMVFAPNGYRATPSSGQEIAKLLSANCLNVTHRYFFDSRPDPLDWKYLTIRQSADDHHKIVMLFRKIYKGKWISSGASKSGLTALFHRRYYPNDADATIAYVSPFTFGPKDSRFPSYLSNIGGSDCFSKLKKIQLYVLKHRTEILNLIDNNIRTSTGTYSLDRELLMELNIMDYPFTFWQYFSLDCSSVPDTATSSTQEIFNHYTGIVPISSFSNENIAYYEPYSYQAITEMGAPAYETGYLKGYLRKINPDASGNPNYELLAPAGLNNTFNSSTVPEIYSWLQNNGNKIIYIYGKNDPWSAGAIELSGKADAIKIIQQGANHRVKIADLDNPGQVYQALEKWLGIIITPAAKKSIGQVAGDEMIPFRLGK